MKKWLMMMISAVALLTACSEIDDSERLIYVDSPKEDGTGPAVYRAALIEDFTAQYCVNCPNAADEIEQLVKEFGEDKVIAVGIHGGPLAHKGGKGSNERMPLCTEMGDGLYDYWKIQAQPIGNVNRTGFATHDLWMGLVREQIRQRAKVKLDVESTYQPTSNSVNAVVTATGLNAVDMMLQVWLVEDSIVSPQMMPDGKAKVDYMHHHVFRTAANGMWGDPVALVQDEKRTAKYEIKLDKEWNPAHLSVVAFVYHAKGNPGEVEQVVKKKISL